MKMNNEEPISVEKAALEILVNELTLSGVRKYTCLNSFGYSQLERDIVSKLTNWQKEQYENKTVLGLADTLTKYIKDKHTQEECIGFSDGFKEAKEQDKAIISELLEALKDMYDCNLKPMPYLDIRLNMAESAITKATEYLQTKN